LLAVYYSTKWTVLQYPTATVTVTLINLTTTIYKTIRH